MCRQGTRCTCTLVPRLDLLACATPRSSRRPSVNTAMSRWDANRCRRAPPSRCPRQLHPRMRRIRALTSWAAVSLLAAHTAAVWGHTDSFGEYIGRWSRTERLTGPWRTSISRLPVALPAARHLCRGLASLRPSAIDRTPLSIITTALAAALVVASAPPPIAQGPRTPATRRCRRSPSSWPSPSQHRRHRPPTRPLQPGRHRRGGLHRDRGRQLSAEPVRRPLGNSVAWMALFCALAVLSKQDFWVLAAMVGTTVCAQHPARRRRGFQAASRWPEIAGIVAIAGVDILLPLLGGFGHATLAGGQGFPSWKRITIDIHAGAGMRRCLRAGQSLSDSCS